MATPSLVKADGSFTPIGTLANYSSNSDSIPVNPAETSGQIPTFAASITDFSGDPNTLVGQDVTLTDWLGVVNSGRVVAANSSASSNLASLDANTIFERLNTEQTTLPVILGEGIGSPIIKALEHWMLMAGVPRFRIDGNLLMALEPNGNDSHGFIADSISKLRAYGPPDSYNYWVPSAATYANPIEVNPSQSVVMGGKFVLNTTLSEFKIDAFIPSTQTAVTYTVRRNGTTWTVREKVGAAAETVLLTASFTATTLNPLFALVKVSANAAADKVDITLRMMEFNHITQNTVFTDYTATAVTSTLRKRPLPSKIALGYNNSLIGGHTQYGPPEGFYMTDKLQTAYPASNSSISLNYAESAKWPYKVPGFTGNVWDKIREFCSLVEVDVSFERDYIFFESRSHRREFLGTYFPALPLLKSNVSSQSGSRETARAVEVLYREIAGVDTSYTNTLLWKADSVYTIEKGETKEEIVQTDSTFVFLNQPVPVSGVPVPYTSAFGSYVITGNDGFIVDPVWWKDNGGSIKVEMTGKSGEIKLIMQAPTVDTTRAPYRVSEGVADRPALYVLGMGLRLTEPKTMKVYTGSPRSSQEIGATHDSVFVTNKILAINTAHKLAAVYGSASSNISFDVSQADKPAPASSSEKLTPLNDSVYHNGSFYRVTSQTMRPGVIEVGTAERFNTIRVLNGEYATGKTIANWNALHAGKLIRDVTISPLPKYES